MSSSQTAQAPRPMAPPPGPTGQLVAPPQQGQVAQPARQRPPRTSAQRVMLISVVTTLVSLLVGIVGFVLVQTQAGATQRVASGADRVLTVMEVRNALLTADGAATNAFLVGGLEPQDRRAVYDDAIERSATLLAELARGADDDAELIARLNADLSTYTALVEAARVNNRQGFPVGAAYLDQASTLLREQMLGELDDVLTMAADDTASDFGVVNVAGVVLGVVIVALVVLVVAQARLARMTRRRLNPGLALATLALAVALVAGALTATSAASDTARLRTDSYRPTIAVAQAAVLVAEARTLESFTLIKRGSGQAYEEEFVARMDSARARLVDETELQGRLADYLVQHQRIRELDDGGEWDDAVLLAVSDEVGGPTATYTAFATEATARVAEGAAEVDDGLADAASSARLASWVLAIAGLIGAIASWRGTAARREEYR